MWAARTLLAWHERFVGRPTTSLLRDLRESQWLAPDELRVLQAERLTALLAHAVARSRFYKRRCDQAGIDAGRPTGDPFAALIRQPVLTKAEIRCSIQELIWTDAPGGLYPASTGGSTGEPLQFFLDRRRQACDLAARLRSHEWFGVRPGDREVFVWGSPIENARANRLHRWRDRLLNHILLNAFDMSPARMDQYLRRIEHYRPRALFGYPSSLALLAEHASARKHGVEAKGLKVVFVTGEVCDAATRSRIESYFRVPVADGYGSREAGFIAHQCPQGSMHITAEHVIVEVLDDDGRAVRPGQSGRIVVTHLESRAMPLIRYDTGDRGRLRAGRCACGRGLPMLDVVEGRTTDFLCLPDGTVRHALSVIYPLRECAAIRRFRVVQGRDYGVTVEVIPHGEPSERLRDEIAGSVRTTLAADVPIHIAFTDRIRESASGKYRYVESHAPDRSAVPHGRGGAP